MTVPTPPAVSEAMREAVARVFYEVIHGFYEVRGHDLAAFEEDGGAWWRRADQVVSGPIASEIARLTGERDDAVAAWYELDDVCDQTLYRARAAEARAEAAEAETARLRAALEDTRTAADELVPLLIAEGDTKGAGALQYVSGFINDRLAALTSQEKTDV